MTRHQDKQDPQPAPAKVQAFGGEPRRGPGMWMRVYTIDPVTKKCGPVTRSIEVPSSPEVFIPFESRNWPPCRCWRCKAGLTDPHA